jgi:hypothetical protein
VGSARAAHTHRGQLVDERLHLARLARVGQVAGEQQHIGVIGDAFELATQRPARLSVK